jgi:glycosyltransferase involved in cell wall biosynthesis
MPKISLVVCLYKERDLLERLLQRSEGCYDDLVVVHDGPEEVLPAENVRCRTDDAGRTVDYEAGWKSPEELSLKEPDAPSSELARDYADILPDAPIPTGYRLKIGQPVPGSVHELVDSYGGRFYEGPRLYTHEPHWPFAWWAAAEKWLLLLDADEFPSPPLKEWLSDFRNENDSVPMPRAYLCKWPLWNGKKATTSSWPDERLFFVNKSEVRYFGMGENRPDVHENCHKLSYVLNHQPNRKSYGVRNILFRKSAYRWRGMIAASLMDSPLKLPRWRWKSSSWPRGWQMMIDRPLLTGLKRLIKTPLVAFRSQWRLERKIFLESLCGGNIHHFLICMQIHFLKKSDKHNLTINNQ